VRSGLYGWCRLYIYKPGGGLLSNTQWPLERAHLCHGQIPVLLHNVLKLNERHRNHPIVDWRRIWVERKYLQLYRVEAVYLDRRLGVGIQIFVELLQYSMYFKGCFWRRQKRRLLLRISEFMPHARYGDRCKLTSHAVKTRFTFRTIGS
jgi:hypothetical protein